MCKPMNEAVRVLEFLSGGWGIGGTELDFEVRVANLNKDLFEPLAVSFGSGGPRLDRLESAGCATARCELDHQKFEQLMAEFRPHIIHYARLSSLNTILLRAQQVAKKYKVPVEIETNIFGRPPRDKGIEPPALTRHLSQTSMLRLSQLTGRSMAHLYQDNHRAVYIPVPTQALDQCTISQDEREAFRAELGIQPTDVVACRVGRADLRKWSQRLALAVPQMLRNIPNLKYVYQSAPATKIAPMKREFGDRLICLPETSDLKVLARLYQSCDLMIHSSAIGESFGASMAEAMYFRLPVVVDSTPNMDNAQVELVDHDRTGLIVGSADGFVKAAERLAADPAERQRLGDGGRAKMLKRCSETVIGQHWEKIYIDLLNRLAPSAVSERHREYAAQLSSIEGIDEGNYPEEYERRLNNLFGPSAGVSERFAIRLNSFRDVVGYMRSIGPKGVWGVVKDRLKNGRLFKRA